MSFDFQIWKKMAKRLIKNCRPNKTCKTIFLFTAFPIRYVLKIFNFFSDPSAGNSRMKAKEFGHLLDSYEVEKASQTSWKNLALKTRTNGENEKKRRIWRLTTYLKRVNGSYRVPRQRSSFNVPYHSVYFRQSCWWYSMAFVYGWGSNFFFVFLLLFQVHEDARPFE